MKPYSIFLLILFGCAFTPLNAQNVGISDDGASFTPNSASVLEIKSTSRGVLLPRLTTAQRTAAATAAGLIVYDTDTDSFWFHDGTSWVELVSNNSAGKALEDADGDTKIQVEESADEDKIRFDTQGSQRMLIDESGNITIGDGTNQTKIESDGSLLFEGNATVFNDLNIPGLAIRIGTANTPGLADVGSFKLFAFDSNGDEFVYFTVQMPHGWKVGSTLYPHIHWTTPSDVSTNAVKWVLDYTWSNLASTFSPASPTSLSTSTPVAPVGEVSQYEHAISAFGSIDGTGKTLSSVILCRLYRDADDAADTYGNDAYLLQIDFHYEVDTEGSRQEYTK